MSSQPSGGGFLVRFTFGIFRRQVMHSLDLQYQQCSHFQRKKPLFTFFLHNS